MEKELVFTGPAPAALPHPSKPQRFIRLPEVLHKVGLSRTSLYRMVATGTFPKPIHPGASRTSVWPEIEVDDWMDEEVTVARVGGSE